MEVNLGVFDTFEERNVQGMENLLHDDRTLWDLFEPELISGTGSAASPRLYHSFLAACPTSRRRFRNE
ncbi:MAG: hypothetical protein OXE48_07615 [Gammaproteobacteria bacterium]|nr:hypothetical protein [Gammaproteobacteria bacterium]